MFTMFIIKTIWSLMKKMPRVISLVLLFINIFLLAFLLLGCTNIGDIYSSTYLIEYTFNKSSPIYPLIRDSYASKNLSGYETLSVRASYLSLCIYIEGYDMQCTSRSDLDTFARTTAVEIYQVNSNASAVSLDIVELASTFSNDIVHPYILIVSVIFTIILFLMLFYIVIPELPGKTMLTRVVLLLSCIVTLLWSIGSIWAHVAVDAGKNLTQEASMGIIKAEVGSKAESMTWVPFSFNLVVVVTLFYLYFRDLKQNQKENSSQLNVDYKV